MITSRIRIAIQVKKNPAVFITTFVNYHSYIFSFYLFFCLWRWIAWNATTVQLFFIVYPINSLINVTVRGTRKLSLSGPKCDNENSHRNKIEKFTKSWNFYPLSPTVRFWHKKCMLLVLNLKLFGHQGPLLYSYNLIFTTKDLTKNLLILLAPKKKKSAHFLLFNATRWQSYTYLERKNSMNDKRHEKKNHF